MNTPPRGRPEDRARANIDRLLTDAGWAIQNRDSVNIEAARGIAIREFLLAPGYGFADYLLYVDGYAVGVVEAKKAGETPTEVERIPIEARPMQSPRVQLPYRPPLRYANNRKATMNLEISSETEARLAAKAQELGVSVEAFIERLLHDAGNLKTKAVNGKTAKVPIRHLESRGDYRRTDIYDDVT